MKRILLKIIIGILFINCSDKNSDRKREIDKAVKTIEREIENFGNTKNGKLKIIDTYQELLLKQQGDKCGEWGGDTKEIRIYKSEYKGNVYADYKKTVIDCKDPYSEKKIAKTIEKKELLLNEIELNLVQESISELVHYKLKTEKQISHSGIWNYVICRDSTLVIEDWPSFDWPKVRELIKQIENK